MGNAIANDNDTINWNNLKTDNFSENLGSKQLSSDSKLLISRLRLNIPQASETESENLSDIFNKYQSVNVPSQIVQNNGELSDTSPFISSDMYNYLLNKNNLNEQPNNGQKGGSKLDEDSSTSSTSDSSSESDSDESKKKKSKKEKSESDSEQSETDENSDLSYVSSPGETDKNNNSEEKSEEQESELSGGSISNNNEDLPPSSINTSDINMVSESS